MMLKNKINKLVSRLYKILRICKNRYYLSALLRCGVAPVDEHGELIKSLDCKTVVDVGANRGQFALLVRNVLPDARIYSFEPLEEPAKKYTCLFQADSNANVFNVAIGAEKSRKDIHVSHADDSSSLLPITHKQSELFPGTEEDHIEKIEVDLLENYISESNLISPSLLKIDVQGFELEVLYGSKSVLNNFDYIYVECSFVELYEGQALANEVIEMVMRENYLISGIYNLIYDSKGRCIQGDFLFEKSCETTN